LKENVERVGALKVRAHINILNQRNKEEDKLRKDMEGVNIQGNIRKNENLLQFLKRSQKDAQDNSVPDDLENFPLIDFPPNFNLLPSKPIFLDLVYFYFDIF